MIEILPAGPWKTREAFEQAIAAIPQAPWVQLDVVDGVFAGTEASWVPARGETLPGSVSVEAHLMVRDPLPIAQLLVEAGAERIFFHIESFATPADAYEAITTITTLGAEAGVTLLLGTPLDEVAPLIPGATSLIQVMSIAKVGAQGTVFDERALARVSEVRTRFPDAIISIDGGVHSDVVAPLVARGVTRLAVGAALFRAPAPSVAYDEMVRLANVPR